MAQQGQRTRVAYANNVPVRGRPSRSDPKRTNMRVGKALRLALSESVFCCMAKTREQKGAIVNALADVFKKGISTVFVHFTKLTVADESKMRRALRSSGVTYTVARKTLIKRALQSAGLDAKGAELPGEIAVAVDTASNDATTAARLIHEFAKSLGGGKLSIVGGIFEGRIVEKSVMENIATIPSMQVLRGMFANIVNSPRARFAVALGEVAKTKN